MTSSTHILVPLDGSERAKDALPYARSLAGATGRITLLQVVPTTVPLRDASGVEIVPETIVGEWMQQDARRHLSGAADNLLSTIDSGVEVVMHVGFGDPASAILRAADEYHADFIVMSSHARGAVGRVAFGSVADRIARSATIPVVITRPEHGNKVKAYQGVHRLIVSLDRSDLSRKAIPVARSMAEQLGAPIHIIHVIDTFSLFMAVTGAPISQPMFDEWYADSRKDLESIAAELQTVGIKTTWAIYQGPTVANIVEISEVGDLIIMTSHGRSGFSRWLIGSVAETLVRTAPVPVCLVPARPKCPVPEDTTYWHPNLDAVEVLV